MREWIKWFRDVWAAVLEWRKRRQERKAIKILITATDECTEQVNRLAAVMDEAAKFIDEGIKKGMLR